MPRKKVPVRGKIASTEDVASVEKAGVVFAKLEHAHPSTWT
ncbi:hypothetical protein [Halomicrococcus sp. SG-WS-1]